MKKSVLISLAAAIAVIALIVLMSDPSTPNSELTAPGTDAQTATSSVRTYRNATYGFTLAYPSTLEEKTYGQNSVVFGHITGNMVRGITEARVLIIQGTSGETFGEAAAQELQNLCAADGPTTTFSCTTVEDIRPFPSGTGVLGLEFYLRGELKEIRTGKITQVRKGPYFAFPIQTGATGSSVLVVHPPLNQSTAEAATSTIQFIAKSVQFDAPQTGDVLLQAYISEHLTQLSPVKAQFGGTFFVTKIEAKDGKGTVEYEDGHNAYAADFTYSTSASGKINVTSFKVRE